MRKYSRASGKEGRKKMITKKEKTTYMLRTKPKYQFPLTDEESEELDFWVHKMYNHKKKKGDNE